MRRELSKLVRAEFDNAIKLTFPGYRKVKANTEFGREIFYKNECFENGGGIFIQLNIDPGSDEFALYIWWTVDGDLSVGVTQNPLADIAKLRQAFCLSDLWTDQNPVWKVAKDASTEELLAAFSSGQSWDEPIENAKKRIPELVKDAFSKLVEFGVPFFEKLKSRHSKHLLQSTGVKKAGIPDAKQTANRNAKKGKFKR